jgi:hypothetical protein
MAQPELVPKESLSDKEKLIYEAYYEGPKRGLGAEETAEEAKRLGQLHNIKITHADVRAFLQRQKVKQDEQPQVHNNYVPTPPARIQYQADVLHYNSGMGARYGLAVIDIFSKLGDIIPLDSIDSHTVARAFVQVCQKQGLPSEVTTDGGGEFEGVFDKMCKYFEIHHTTLISYPRFVDRFILTIKKRIKRERHGLDKYNWTEVLPEKLHQYNEIVRSRVTGYTPKEVQDHPAMDEDIFKSQLAQAEKFKIREKRPVLKADTSAELKDGDYVRILKTERKDKPVDESKWSDTIHRVTSVFYGDQGVLYDVTHHSKPLIRADLLYIPNREAAEAQEAPGDEPPAEGPPPAAAPAPRTPFQLPAVGRPLRERLGVVQMGQAEQFSEFVPKAIKLIWNAPGRRMLGYMLRLRLQLPTKISGLDWARLYPTKFRVEGRSVFLMDGVRPTSPPRRGRRIRNVRPVVADGPAPVAPAAPPTPAAAAAAAAAPATPAKAAPLTPAERFEALRNIYGRGPR